MSSSDSGRANPPSKRPGPTRARDEADKQARRAQILAAAEGLFEERDFDAITVSAVARRAGLAKGTVYLYFHSKEELFLQLVLDRIEPWFQTLAPELAVVESPEALGRLLASGLARRPVLLRLLAIEHVVLERNVDLEVVRRFKRQILGFMRAAAVRLEARFTALKPGEGFPLMTRLYALVIGLYQTTNPSATVREALETTPELAMLSLDFETELAACIAAIVRGAEARSKAEESAHGQSA